MNSRSGSLHFESRWSVALAVFGVILLLAILPNRITLFPTWIIYVVGVAVLLPIGAVGLTGAKAPWLRVERTVTFLFVLGTGFTTLTNLTNLISGIVGRSPEISGLQLLASSVAVWVTTVLIFSMLYWQIDRGGPEARMNDGSIRPDWLFPQEEAPVEAVPMGWRPTFIDYLYLGYSTATSFSTTDAVR